jgi:hypothetical protein
MPKVNILPKVPPPTITIVTDQGSVFETRTVLVSAGYVTDLHSHARKIRAKKALGQYVLKPAQAISGS